ncbi:bifunctional methylenetetrahydrofolate dehydrogenase/methenyltetrahydrofolate cyclohydrolase FolD [Bdellovibrio sp. 22V]|uniref:bifunctional methylenetetrahydrofolate dehydrogenase/methenyltetrahydrofolate cyclohydrolase FolD n=1 Tax=Bdellovibrio TaxID=958 RepID=UPI00254363A7|nr:bifunctional methylenetetrahydrofolate dehydrogenase/methenyltetrahydrofolate cyclohydrolase FolD [Bdellovibrio sp. 22V]WII73153.1 bifunctional methylenetetrahydrofolate dehydrogenase/methenyltetrahydrofolate cyclohydrolase FolD [Bdellovibrio sp. 22V]
MLILNGKEVAKEVRSSLTPRVLKFFKDMGRAPHLSVIIVGDDKASHIYVRNKKIACESVGMTSTIHALPVSTTQQELDNHIMALNQDENVDGILVQFPLPPHLNADEVLKLVSPEKDADGLTYASLGYFFAGKPLVRPCTPEGVMTILKHYQIETEGAKAVVVGRSNIVGKPMAQMLTEANATVTLCHSRTKDLHEVTKHADIVVVAAGKARLLGKDAFKKGSVVIDVGMHQSGHGGKLCGDVRFEELEGWAKAATPVPGGVGPMTIATLLQNTCLLAEKRAGFR